MHAERAERETALARRLPFGHVPARSPAIDKNLTNDLEVCKE